MVLAINNNFAYGGKVKGGEPEEVPAGAVPDGSGGGSPERAERLGAVVREGEAGRPIY